MKADTSDTPIALELATAITLSRAMHALALVLMLLSAAPTQVLAARSWEVGTDITLNLFRKHIELTTDPAVLDVELPAGQAEIEKIFMLELPGDHPLIVMSDKIAEMYRYHPAVFGWAQNPWEIPMLFKTEVHVSAEGNNRIFEVTIELGGATLLGDRSTLLPSEWKMYMQVAPEFYPDLPDGLPDNSQPSLEAFRDISTGVGQGFLNIYKDRVYEPEKYGLLLDERNTRQHQEPKWMRLKVTLREVPFACWMQVEYWGESGGGDFKGNDSGDLAYYNYFLKSGSRYRDNGGVARATGSAVDPTAQAALGVLMGAGPTGIASALNEMVFSEEEASVTGNGEEVDVFGPEAGPSEGEGDSPPVNLPPPSDDWDTAQESFYSWLGEKVEGEALETFGITMAGRSVTDERIKGLGQMITASVLEAASNVNLTAMQADPNAADPWSAPIPLSRLDFKPMVMASPFHWSEGKPGFGTLQVTALTANVLAGEIYGILYSHELRKDDGSDSEIRVHAKFIAAEGAFGCDAPGVDKILK